MGRRVSIKQVEEVQERLKTALVALQGELLRMREGRERDDIDYVEEARHEVYNAHLELKWMLGEAPR